jgi:hypothetical protein
MKRWAKLQKVKEKKKERKEREREKENEKCSIVFVILKIL